MSATLLGIQWALTARVKLHCREQAASSQQPHTYLASTGNPSRSSIRFAEVLKPKDACRSVYTYDVVGSCNMPSTQHITACELYAISEQLTCNHALFWELATPPSCRHCAAGVAVWPYPAEQVVYRDSASYHTITVRPSDLPSQIETSITFWHAIVSQEYHGNIPCKHAGEHRHRLVLLRLFWDCNTLMLGSASSLLPMHIVHMTPSRVVCVCLHPRC